MLALLKTDHPLHCVAIHNLAHPPKDLWFLQLRKIALKYGLPDPPKGIFKAQVKNAINAYCHQQLSEAAKNKPSLKYFRASHMPLGHGPHPLWSSCSHEAVRATMIQAKMLVGTCYHVLHWQRTSGECLLPGCGIFPREVEHLFLFCSFLS